MKKQQQFITLGIVAIVFAVCGFFGGTMYQKSKTPQFTRGAATTMSAIRQNGTQTTKGTTNGNKQATQGKPGNGMGGMTIGEVTAMDATSLTVKLQDGSTKLILISPSTTYTKSIASEVGEIKVGDTIAVAGETASGTTTATSIQINPVATRFGQPNGAPQN